MLYSNIKNYALPSLLQGDVIVMLEANKILDQDVNELWTVNLIPTVTQEIKLPIVT